MLAYNKARLIAEKAYFIKRNFVTRPSFSFQYLCYRLLRPFLKFAYRRFLKKIPHAPWITPAAIQILDTLLTKQHIGFEFGSGNSTLFFAKRVKQLISLEHEPTWHYKISTQLLEEKINNVNYFLVAKENKEKPFLPKKRSDDLIIEFTPATCFQSYYSFIDQYPEEYFDFIIVDGRARVECSLHAISKLKPGGLLILDNSERRRYQPVHDTLTSWLSVQTSTGMTDTTLWFKPER